MSKHTEFCKAHDAHCLCVDCERDQGEVWCCAAAHPDKVSAGGLCGGMIVRCGDFTPVDSGGDVDVNAREPV